MAGQGSRAVQAGVSRHARPQDARAKRCAYIISVTRAVVAFLAVISVMDYRLLY